jgi:hypothetical protein
MDFKGTQGKWALHHEYSPKLLVIAGDYSEDVCDCLLAADALLISKAPELFDLCKMVYDSFGGGNVITFSEKDIETFKRVLEEATEVK